MENNPIEYYKNHPATHYKHVHRTKRWRDRAKEIERLSSISDDSEELRRLIGEEIKEEMQLLGEWEDNYGLE